MVKGKFDGERLFIIGTAPSLTVTQMRLVQNEFTFGHGALCNWPARPYWPYFYGVSEETAYLDYKTLLESSPCALAVSFPVPGEHYPVSGHPRYQKFYQPIPVDESRWLHINAPHSPYAFEAGFGGVDIDARIGRKACYSSSFCTPVQVGAWLGFKKMYLIGVDLTSTGYVYNQNHRRAISTVWQREGVLLNDWLSKQGVKIANCSPGYIGNEIDGIPAESLRDVLGIHLSDDGISHAIAIAEGQADHSTFDDNGISVTVEATEWATVARIEYNGVVIGAYHEDNVTPEHNRTHLAEFLNNWEATVTF